MSSKKFDSFKNKKLKKNKTKNISMEHAICLVQNKLAVINKIRQ